jgi:anti-sigma factor RsiW
MMWSRHVRHRIAAFADAALDPSETARVEAHLERCPSCREALESHRAVAALLRQMSPIEAPAGLWHSIESALDRPSDARVAPGRWSAWAGLTVAAVVLVIAGTASAWWFMSRPEAWDVVRLDQRLAARVANGQWLETDASSTAAVRIGEIGRVDLAPDTRLQLLIARPNEHRLNLTRGRISVQIVAPPRVFIVETPASTVVDLGCAYTLDVDPDGGGTVRVTQGWVALEWANRASLVPAGASARTRPSIGPGTPVFDDATDALRRALGEFDFGIAKGPALAVVLAESRERDTLTLWHLMSRVADAERVTVFERLVSLTPLPDGVTRERALALDADTMRRWREELAWTW